MSPVAAVWILCFGFLWALVSGASEAQHGDTVSKTIEVCFPNKWAPIKICVKIKVFLDESRDFMSLCPSISMVEMGLNNLELTCLIVGGSGIPFKLVPANLGQ
ncbi:uncharacterized protein LOC116165997 [Photinus pyralis]|uniref:uncharacterized protein LOC116165997 n=1 Tax=Photinus pyralis TaxID=7054 RepID=UPI00126773EF|nr:uncharacterized protein LOC116165997 [Photinus pyralis]